MAARSKTGSWRKSPRPRWSFHSTSVAALAVVAVNSEAAVAGDDLELQSPGKGLNNIRRRRSD